MAQRKIHYRIKAKSSFQELDDVATSDAMALRLLRLVKSAQRIYARHKAIEEKSELRGQSLAYIHNSRTYRGIMKANPLTVSIEKIYPNAIQ